MPADLKYRRVLLKISGEALMGDRDYGLDPKVVARIADEIKSVHALGEGIDKPVTDLAAEVAAQLKH